MEVEQKSTGKTSMNKASGVKVKDNAGLLKKSIKKLEQRKKSSKRKWEERNMGMVSRKEAKQSKNLNIITGTLVKLTMNSLCQHILIP